MPMFRLRKLPVTLLLGLLMAFSVAAACEGDGDGKQVIGQQTDAAAADTGDQEPAEPEATNTPTDQEECEEAGGRWHKHYFTPRDAECHVDKSTSAPSEQEECEEAGGKWHNHNFSFRGGECHPATPTPEPTNPSVDAPTEQEECEEAGGRWHSHTFSFSGAECHPATPTPEPTDTPEPPWETGPVTEETVREALDDLDNLGLFRADIGKDNITFLSVIPHWETDGYIIAIEFKPRGVWSTKFLTVAGQSTLVAMAKLFANDEVDRVQISATAGLIDALGNTSTERVTTATINRAKADQINWQGFADRQSLDNKHIFCVADAFIIRPVLYNELGDTGCLPGPSRSEG